MNIQEFPDFELFDHTRSPRRSVMASAWTGPHARRSRIQLAFSRGACIGIPPPHKPMLGLILAWAHLRNQACWAAAYGTG